MDRRWILGALLLIPAGAAAAGNPAAVRVSIRLPQAPTAESFARLRGAEPLLERLLAPGAGPAAGPFAGPGARYERLSPRGFHPSVPEAERLRLIKELRAEWGDDLTVETVDPAAPASQAARPARPAHEDRPAMDARRESVRVASILNVGGSRSSQDLYYDGAFRADGADGVVAAAAPTAVRAASTPRSAGLHVAPPPAPAAKPEEKVKLWKMGWEALKGAGESVKEVFTWRGLAIAAGAVALATLAPVTVYGFLALGVGMGAYTIGKAIYDGVKADKRGDTEGVYAASRDFGKGALTLGLSIFGARHAPKSLRPHIPKSGEYKALLSAMDDEAVTLNLIAQRFLGKAEAH